MNKLMQRIGRSLRAGVPFLAFVVFGMMGFLLLSWSSGVWATPSQSPLRQTIPTPAGPNQTVEECPVDVGCTATSPDGTVTVDIDPEDLDTWYNVTYTELEEGDVPAPGAGFNFLDKFWELEVYYDQDSVSPHTFVNPVTLCVTFTQDDVDAAGGIAFVVIQRWTGTEWEVLPWSTVELIDPGPPAVYKGCAEVAGFSMFALAAQPSVLLPITLNITLQRPNAPAPDPSWAVPVHFSLHPLGMADIICWEWDRTLDQSGEWSGDLNLTTGLYDARLKNPHTLRNVKYSVNIAGATTIDMGELLEGDASNDNFVKGEDFSILRTTYWKNAGEPGFDPRADFDENGSVNAADFSLLRTSYWQCGDIEVP